MAKADIFLHIEGKQTGVIKGESNVPEHPEEIEISEWSWGMTGSSALGGAGSRVRTALSELRLGKGTDRATTQLMSVMRNNEVIKKAVLSVRKAGAVPPLDYLTITIENGRITSHTIGTLAPDSPTLVESFSIAFEGIEVNYTPQQGSGSKAAQLSFRTSVIT
jgi:type VI secretion system secreted protein Hcp